MTLDDDGKPEPPQVAVLIIGTISGPTPIWAPPGWVFDKTAAIVWYALLGQTRLKDFRRQRDKFMAEAKIEALANVLANSIGMAAPYWIVRAREIAPMRPPDER